MINVRTSCESGMGRLSLDRPKALNALTREMCEIMSEALLAWRDDPVVQAVVIDHATGEGTGRGFCAGGDVAMVRRSAIEDGGEAGRAFFHAEYQLNHLLFTYPKPVVAFMDGITMGGGVGLSLPAQHRVVSENTLFAMPEGSIGLFPDVGGGYYLSRLPHRIGQFLALTGARLDGAECHWAGLGTHYMSNQDIDAAKAEIAAAPQDLSAILERFSRTPPEPRLAGNAENIARLFASDKLEEIMAELAADPSKWAGKELKAISGKCPFSSKVALRLIAQGGAVENFAEEMRREYAVAARMIARPDFIEGVRAVLVDKDNAPKWKPANAEEVTEEMLDEIFAPLPAEKEWNRL